ncbi:MAG: hypothetical protein ACRDZ3_20895 [Acidimicrobiia bacterium]
MSARAGNSATGVNEPTIKPTMKADLTVGPAPPPEVRAPAPGEGLVDDVVLLEESVPQVDETVVRSMLRAVGGGLGYGLGDEDVPDHWRFTEGELDDLTPPLTRVINRNAKLRRAVIRGDEMAVGVVVAGYVGRNVNEGYKAGRARRERDGETPDAQGDVRAHGPGLVGGGGGWENGAGDGRGHDDPAGGDVDR